MRRHTGSGLLKGVSGVDEFAVEAERRILHENSYGYGDS